MGALYGDASGDEQGDLIAVAGFVAPISEWLLFDTEWQFVLREAEIKYFRMSEFAQSTGEFKCGWRNNEPKRRALLDRLIGIIAKRVRYSVASCVPRADYLKVDAEYRLHEQTYPYTLCAFACAEMAKDWHEANHLDEPFEIVFEDGDAHKGQAQERIEKDLGIIPIFRKKHGEQSDGLITPLQAADFAAYEHRLATKKWEGPDILATFRTSFLRLAGSVVFAHGRYGERELRVMCRATDVRRRCG
jgi:hypothetical protein